MTIKIMSMTYDKNFVDNTNTDPDTLDPSITPCIKFTARVIDTTTGLPPRNPVTIQWSSTRQAVQYYDMNGAPLSNESNQTTTDTNGIAEVYTTSTQPAFPTVQAEPVPDDGGGPMGKSVVFCTIQDNSGSVYPAPYFQDVPVTMTDDQVYAITAKVDQSRHATNDEDFIVAWMATLDVDGSVVDRYLLTKPEVTYKTLCNHGFGVPFEYMRTQDKGSNVLQYLVCEQQGSATVSRWGPFTAIGTAYAMPDPQRTMSANYPQPVYVDKHGNPQPNLATLGDDSFYKVNGSMAMQFKIPSWDTGNVGSSTSNGAGVSISNADDILDIYMYINGYVAGSDVPDSKVAYLGRTRYGDMQNGIFTVRKGLLNLYCADSSGDPGKILLTYLVNDIAWSPDQYWTTYFTGSLES